MKKFFQTYCVYLLVFLPFLALGQYGPMGFGNSTGSPSLEGHQDRLVLWLDGRSVDTSDPSIFRWADKSGNGHDFVQANTSLRPTYQANMGPGATSTPSVLFDGNDRLTCNSFLMSNGVTGQNEFSVYIVYRTNDSKYGLFTFGPDADPDQIALYGSNTDSYLNLGDNPIDYDALSGGLFNLQVNDLSNNHWEYQGLYWSAPKGKLWEYKDGSSADFEDNSSYASGFNFSASGQAVLGDIPLAPASSDTYEPGAGFSGQIAEVIIWEGFLSREKARLMRTYMWLKYGENGGQKDFKEDSGGWDKFQGNYNNSYGSKYYENIAIGYDVSSSNNPGEHNESRLNGLVLKKPNSWGSNRGYLVAGQEGTAANVKTTANLSTTPGVVQRWSRVWEIRLRDAGQSYKIAFDFEEGINGAFPQNVSNYKLIRRSGNSGNFTALPLADPILLDNEVVFTVPASALEDANFYYTIGTTDIAASPLDGANFKTWFAYQTGNWNQPTTWTLDGSSAPAYINPNGSVPAAGDNVEIGSGRTVTITVSPVANNPIVQNSVRVDGTLNLATLATSDRPSFGTIAGSGVIRCAADNFPTGITTAFADADKGGLAVFYGSGYVISNNLLLNKIQINLSTPTSNIALNANLTHNGLMEVKKGIFYVDDPITTSGDSRTITSKADVLVESNGRIFVSTESVSKKHIWNFDKDLISNGLIHFTNRTLPSTTLYNTPETSHWIEARFINDTENQELRANGLHTYMSRIVIDKGEDLTYELSISANAADRFRLLGHCDVNFDTPNVTESNNSNSCAIINGTLRVKENIFIPLHAGSNNYCIPPTARLWVDGGIVVKGKNSKGAIYGPSVGEQNTQAIVPYGEVKVTGGMLNAWCKSGLTTRANGLIVIEGGTINTNAIRTSVQGPSNIGGILLSGGLVDIDGTLDGGVNNDYYTFSLTYPGNLFRMTGGTLKVAGPSNNRGLIFINSDPEQTNVSGGRVVAIIKDGVSTNERDDHRISSKAAFWDLEIKNTATAFNESVRIGGGYSFDENIGDLPLFVKNSLIINGDNSRLNMFDTGGSPDIPVDLHVEGDFIIDNSGEYLHNTNTTYLEGDANTIIEFPNSTGVTPVTFNNLVVNKATSTRSAEITRGINPTFTVEGEFKLENGFFENNNFGVHFLGDVDIRSNFGTSTSTGIARMSGSSSQILKSQNGIFHNFRIDNSSGVTLENGNLEVRKDFRLEDGNFFLRNFKLRIATSNGSLLNTSGNANLCFVTNGSASAGGLEIINKTSGQELFFPIGVEDEFGVIKYTPATITVNGGWGDDGFIRVVPVDEVLPTADASAGVDHLSFYWRVLHSDYTNIPNVSHRFVYDDSDILGDENEFASGRVLSELPFLRAFDYSSTEEDHVIAANNSIYFNGSEEASTNLGIGPGTGLVNADYTAGNWERFVGQPKIYFSRSTTLYANWEDENNWRNLSSCSGCTTPGQYHSSATDVGGGFPGAGDIAYIGFDPSSAGYKPHLYTAPSTGVQATLVGFTAMQDAAGVRQKRWSGPASEIGLRRPTLSFGTTNEISNIGQITGEGALMLTGPADLNATDIGNFLLEDSSIVVLQPTSELILPSFPASVPNLFITKDPSISGFVVSKIQPNVFVMGNLEIAGNARLRVHSGNTGDYTVGGNLVLGQFNAGSSSPQLLFSFAGSSRRFEVLGDVKISGLGAKIGVVAPNNIPQLIHEFIVWKDIYQNISGPGVNLGLNFFASTSDADDDFISLTLRGTGNHNFVNNGGSVPRLGRLIMDKGFDTSSSFNFNGDVDIEGPANLPQKSVDLRNGLLTFNHPNIDITLSSGSGNFVIPGSAGLILGDGALDITGDETGILLDGLLQVDGGTISIGDTEGENNFIEYSTSGNAKIEVNGGNLIVGSQIRRGLTNTAGVLSYVQTGGNVTVGRYDAPSSTRAVFEIVNSGSRFDHTGGNLTIVRGINNAIKSSFLLEPEYHTVSGTSEIIIGGADSPTSGSVLKNFGFQSHVALNRLSIDNSSGANPEVKVQVEDLFLNGLLSIDAGAEFDFDVRNLTLRNDLINEGLLTANTGALIFDHTGVIPFSVSGSGVYNLFDVNRVGGGTTNIDSDLLIDNDYTQDVGTVNFNINKLILKGDATIDGSLLFNASSQGLIFDGSVAQTLRRSGPGSSIVNTITINNSSGVEMIAGAGYIFNIEHKMRLARGVFDLLGNVLIINENARFEAVNSFGENNMINAGGAFTNFGVLVYIPNNSVELREIPLGIDRYMPILMKFEDEFGNSTGYSSGNNAGGLPSSYLFTLNIPTHPVIQEDDEGALMPPQPSIPDVANVLSMFFTVDADNIGTGLKMDIDFKYDDQYMNVVAPNTEEDYIAARVFTDASNNDIIQKFPDPLSVDETFNIVRFSYDDSNGSGDEEDIDGDYFAGVNNAIPEIVPVYSTTTDMNVEDGLLYTTGPSTTVLSAGQSPRGARVNIIGNDVLNVASSTQSIDFYRTDIAPNATLQIDGAGIHRLGRVTGSGTLRLINTGSLPSGNYNDFFVCNSGFGGKLEYQGTGGSFEVLANLSLIEKVDFTGTGTMQVSNNDVQICTNLTVNGPTLEANGNTTITIDGNLILEGNGTLNQGQGDIIVEGDVNITDNAGLSAGNLGITEINGNLNMNGTSSSILNLGTFSRQTILRGDFTKSSNPLIQNGTGGAQLIFEGNSSQTITGDYTGTNKRIPYLTINNSSGLNLSGNVEISDTLALTLGNINTSNSNNLILENDGVDIVPRRGKSTSYINGPLVWKGIVPGASERVFPVGKDDALDLDERFRPLSIIEPSATRTWTAEYFNGTASDDLPSVANMQPEDPVGIKEVSIQEYWVVNSGSVNPTNAKIGLTWGNNSAVSPNPVDYSKLIVLSYNNVPTPAWYSFGGSDFLSTTGATGRFQSQSALPFSERVITLGSRDLINPLPVTWLYFDGETFDENHILNWATASEKNNDYFQLERSIDAKTWFPIAQIDGSGQSTTQTEYNYTDRDAPYGRVYYRIKQVDFDGDFDFYPNVLTLNKELHLESSKFDFVLYPNPANYKSVKLILPGYEDFIVEILITDMTGKSMSRQKVQIDGQGISQQIDCNFRPGIYLVTLSVNDKIRSKPLVIGK